MTDVLDYGYVNLLEKMGNDLTPAQAARISYGQEPRGWDNGDGKLTRYLLEHGHMSPFEMVEVMWEVKAPIFVARQWVRHRTANWNEFSMRYADPSKLSEDEAIEYYTPSLFSAQSSNNKQSSAGVVEDQRDAWQKYTYAIEVAIKLYKQLAADGVSREQARAVLPTAVYTKWMWKCDLRNTLHFLELRTHEGAQWEIRQYADAMVSQLREKLPHFDGAVATTNINFVINGRLPIDKRHDLWYNTPKGS